MNKHENDASELKVDERKFLALKFLDSNLDVIAQLPRSMPDAAKPVAANSSLQTLLLKSKLQLSSLSHTFTQYTAEEQASGTGFFFVPVWLGLGSIIYFTAGFEPSSLSLLSLVICLAVWRLAAQRHSGVHLVATIFVLVGLGAGFAKVQTWRNSTAMLAGDIATQITARVISINPTAKAHRAVLEILQTTKPELKYAPRRVRVTLKDGADSLTAGNVISVRARLMPPSGPIRPTSYDFAFQAYFDGIGASGFSIGPVTLVETQNMTMIESAVTWLERVRQAIAKRIRTVIKGSEGEIAVALIAGVQSGIDEATIEPLRITGLAHILSISGLHMALVAGLFMVTIRGGFALFPGPASRLPTKKYAAALALLASFFYLLLSGADVAATRSFLMLAVFLVAILLDQQALTMRNLSIAAIVILAVTPHEVMGPSFQMSFAATAALISAYAYWARIKPIQTSQNHSGIVSRAGRKVWRFIIALSMTSIIAGTATSLFSAWHFHRLAPMGLPANLAAMPPVSLIVMPSAVISALAMPFGLEEWPLKAMGAGIGLMLAIAKALAKLSSAGLSGALNTTPFLCATSVLLCLCLLQTRLKWLALLPLPFILYAFWTPKFPDILISEDAKIVAVRHSGNRLSVNQIRPNTFTFESWQKALLATAIQLPTQHVETNQTSAFVCEDITCTINLPNGAQLTWLGYPKYQRPNIQGIKPKLGNSALRAFPSLMEHQTFKDNALKQRVRAAIGLHPNKRRSSSQTNLQQPLDRAAIEAIFAAKFDAAIRIACGKTDMLIIAGPASQAPCSGTKTAVISAKDLALNGAAEVYLLNENNEVNINTHSVTQQQNEPTPGNERHRQKTDWFTTKYAIGEPNRPWNFERKFSRAARSLPPFQAIPNTKPISNGE